MSAAPRAVLWDMDGTLLDSGRLHFQAWQDTMAALGRALSRAEFDAGYGRRNDDILRAWFGPNIAPAEIDRIAGIKEARYRALLRPSGIAALPGILPWIGRLGADGWRQAVATAGPRANVEAVVGVLGLGGRFAAIVAAEDVARGKPDPEVFLAAAARLGVPPARSVVVEDGPAGIEAARRAGMRAIGLLTTHAALDADLVVRAPADIPADAFDRLLGD